MLFTVSLEHENVAKIGKVCVCVIPTFEDWCEAGVITNKAISDRKKNAPSFMVL